MKIKFLHTLVAQLVIMSSSYAKVWEEVLQEITQSQAKIVILGDKHGNENHLRALNDLVINLNSHDKGWNCVLSELDPTWFQKPLDETIKDPSKYSTLAQRVYEETPTFVQVSYGVDYFTSSIPDKFPEYFIKTLSETGVKIIGIDKPKEESYLKFVNLFPNMLMGHNPTKTQWDRLNRLQMIERNLHMSQEITRQFQSGKCQRAIVFVGGDHISQYGELYETNEVVIPLQDLLAKKHSTETVSLFFDQEEIDKYQSRLNPGHVAGGLKRLSLDKITYTGTVVLW